MKPKDLECDRQEGSTAEKFYFTFAPGYLLEKSELTASRVFLIIVKIKI